MVSVELASELLSCAYQTPPVPKVESKSSVTTQRGPLFGSDSATDQSASDASASSTSSNTRVTPTSRFTFSTSSIVAGSNTSSGVAPTRSAARSMISEST